MAFIEPEYSKRKVNRAGDIFLSPTTHTSNDVDWATRVLANWRACHAYPINTFQATLRNKLREGYGEAIVAQRLKRTPSIISKLERFDNMKLARMQDIGGLRAVVSSVARVRRLEHSYRETRFGHVLFSSKNYIDDPKDDGYRSVHLIYKYANARAPAYDGLFVELQIRTQLQHAWATAVETMGTFLGQALKSGAGEAKWREFFTAASAAIAIEEKTAPVPGFESHSHHQAFHEVAALEKSLNVLDLLSGFAIATEHVTSGRGAGPYHLIILDSKDRTVRIRPYSLAQLGEAASDYAEIEELAGADSQIEAVLVSAGPVEALRRAYPNYFLDTQVFIGRMRKIIERAHKPLPSKGTRKKVARRAKRGRGRARGR